jgi:cytochrome c-type biogenesis protein CcmH/NrfF
MIHAGYGAGNPRLEKLYASYLSPCCWRENLTSHSSREAEDLRAQIAGMVKAGLSDEDIKAALIKQYTKHILALPEGAEALWLFWTPVLAGAIGCTTTLMFVRRSRGKQDAAARSGLAPAELEDNWDAA